MTEYSFVVPIYNDGMLAEAFCNAFQETFRATLGRDDIAPDVELIFVNDGSRDGSQAVLTELAERHSFMRVIELSRTFGQHVAVSCGYHHARGKYVGMLNVDMQDPPDQIPVLLECLEQDQADIAIGVRHLRESPFIERVTSRLFNVLLNKLTGYNFPVNVATLRIMNRPFVDAYNRLTEKSPFIPGLEGWLGFRHAHIPIQHQKRSVGRSSYSFVKRLLMAIDSIISFSDLPLRMAVWGGMTIAFLGFLSGLWLIIMKLFLVAMQPGYTSTSSLILFMSGIIILVLGVAGLYIGRILKEVQNRPLYIIRNRINFPLQNDETRP